MISRSIVQKMHKIASFFIALLAISFTFSLSAVSSSAQTMTSSVTNTNSMMQPTVYHQHPPMNSWETAAPNMMGQIRLEATVRNANSEAWSTPVCVTEWMNGISYHKGCVPEVAFGGRETYNAFHFNAWSSNTPGAHTISYSYRTPDGMWHEVMNQNNQMQRLTYNIQ